MRLFLISILSYFIMIGTVLAGGHTQDGWIIKDSVNSVEITADKLVAIIEKAPPKLFARIDHAAGAKSIGAELAASTLVIFGAPAIGTPIMQENIKAGLDLPIRVLVWDEAGQTKIGYLDPHALKERYKISGAEKALMGMAAAVGKFTDGAAK